MKIHSLDGVKLKQTCNAMFRLSGAMLPECISQTTPGIGKANLIGVGVLNNQPLQSLPVTAQDSEADRAAVVLHEQPITIKSLCFQKILCNFRKPVECVREFVRIGHVAVSEPRIVRGKYVKASREGRD